ncbi:MAG TPA: acyltransferase [Propioniciclava tarda]|nr:acyltransferase [Propioniciclava tarda]
MSQPTGADAPAAAGGGGLAGRLVTSIAPRADGMLFGARLNPRRNSLNLVRLILASSVIVHHAYPLISKSDFGPQYFGDGIGGWAVAGFFCLSGYLITGSRFGKSFGDYLTLRIARIYPAFIMCLVVTAFVFAPLNFFHQRGNLAGFWSTSTTPAGYIFSNLTLKMYSWDAAGTPIGVPYAAVWNGSLWSLYYEFFCYVIVGILGCFAIARRSPWPVVILWLVSIASRVAYPNLSGYLGMGFDGEVLTKLVPYFLAGGVLHVVKRRIGMHWLAALVSIVLFVLCMKINVYAGGQVGSLFAAYALLYAGHLLPSPEWTRVHDVSYGMYIYGFPTQQLVMTFAPRVGFFGLIGIALVGTSILASASWFLLERPIIDRVRDSLVAEHKAPPPVAPLAAPPT